MDSYRFNTIRDIHFRQAYDTQTMAMKRQKKVNNFNHNNNQINDNNLDQQNHDQITTSHRHGRYRIQFSHDLYNEMRKILETAEFLFHHVMLSFESCKDHNKPTGYLYPNPLSQWYGEMKRQMQLRAFLRRFHPEKLWDIRLRQQRIAYEMTTTHNPDDYKLFMDHETHCECFPLRFMDHVDIVLNRKLASKQRFGQNSNNNSHHHHDDDDEDTNSDDDNSDQTLSSSNQTNQQQANHTNAPNNNDNNNNKNKKKWKRNKTKTKANKNTKKVRHNQDIALTKSNPNDNVVLSNQPVQQIKNNQNDHSAAPNQAKRKRRRR